MALVLHRSDVGEDLREPLSLAPRRRRLSTLAARRIPGRPCIVSVHRKGAMPFPCDDTVKLRGAWKDTLIGPHDTVVITYLPLGGAMGGAGSSKGGKAIGAAVAMIAVAVAAPFLVGALAPSLGLGGILGTSGALTLTGKIVAAGIVAGAGYFLSKATKAKANQSEDTRPAYGVSGGGNLPRPGDRIPVNYGRCWSQPDLSQPDYFVYNGDDQVLYKILTVGGGKYKTHAIRVGEALMWTESGGLQAPFTNAQIEFIPPGQRSQLVGTVYSSQNVAGIELPYQNDPSPWAGPFPVTEPGVKTNVIQLDFSFPQGAWTTHPRKPDNLPTPYGAVFYYAPIDDDGNLIGSMIPLYTFNDTTATTRAIRKSITVNVPMGRYAVMARNYTNRLEPALEQAGVRSGNTAMWDGLRAHLFNEPPRPEVTEIALKISATAMGSTMSFSDIWVETTSILPVNAGGVWSEQPTRKAVWAALDVLRNSTYGGAYPDYKIDFDTFLHYANAVSENDTFDGQIRGPVSVYEAAATVLGVMRAEPVLIGDTWSMVRDEPRQYQKHVISRRQIVKDTSGAEFDLDMTTGDADVILEYYVNGDPRRRAEFRATIGAETITPNRIQGFGVSSHDHAVMLARWYAACAYYRRETRLLSTEMAGRIMQRNDPAMIDTWFLDTTQAAGVEGRSGRTLTLDVDFTLPAGAHVVLRDQTGMEWGPIAVTAGADPRSIVLDPDDVAVIETYTGRSLASLFGRTRRRLPVTVMLGTLAELSKPYIIRTAKPESANRMQITAVYDAPEVWSVLGEAVPPAPPIKEVITNEADLAPVLPWVRGYVIQKATAIVLEWSVGVARSARRYKVDIAYGADGPFEQIYLGGETEGSYVVEYREGVDLRIRACAINGQGIPSLPIYTTAVLPKPVINNAIADMLVELADLQEQVRKDIIGINDAGKQLLDIFERGELLDIPEFPQFPNPNEIGDGQSLLGRVRDLKRHLEELAAAQATETTDNYEQRRLVKVQVGGAYAAISREERARVSGDEALAEVQTALAARIQNAEDNLDGQATAVEDLKTAVQLTGTGMTASSGKITQLESRVTNTESSISGQATALSGLTTRVTAAEGEIDALSSDVTSLESTVNNPTTGVSANAAAIGQLTTRVTTAEGTIDTTSSDVAALKNTVNNPTTGVGASATAVSELKTAVGFTGSGSTSSSSKITALENSFSSMSGTVSAQGTAITGLTNRVTASEGNISTLSTDVTALKNTVNNPTTGVNASATAISQLTTRVTTTEGNVSSLSSQTSTLQTTVGGHTSTLTSHAASIDGVKAQYGIGITLDGAFGGWVLTGAKQMDGSAAFTMGIYGNLVVNGSIFGTKLAASNIITASAQIGNLTVDHLNVKDWAITNTASASATTGRPTVAINVRGLAKVAIFAQYMGSPGTPRSISQAGYLTVYRNNIAIAAVQNNYFQAGNTSVANYHQQTTLIYVDQPGNGVWNYGVDDTWAEGGVTIVVMELSK